MGVQSKYMRYNRTDLPAHIYGVSAAAYWALCDGHGCQEIVLAGESGSGKTFAASVVLEHLIAAAHLSRTAFDSQPWTPVESTFEDVGAYEEGRLRRLVACHRMILESFGNATTVIIVWHRFLRFTESCRSLTFCTTLTSDEHVYLRATG